MVHDPLTPPLRARPFIDITRTGAVVTVKGAPTFSVRHDLMADGRAGVTADWVWDGQALHATTDRFGTYPLYYFATSDRICVSPSLLTLLEAGVPAELDDAAVATFLWFGCCLGDDTLIAAIRRVPPAGRLNWCADGQWSVTGVSIAQRPLRLTRAAALDAFIDTFRAAVRRRPPSGEVVVPLTGGRDSRHLLFEVRAAGFAPLRTVTVRHFEPNRRRDVSIATQVAAAAGVEHLALDQYASRLASELRKNRLCSFESDWHSWMLPLVAALEAQPRRDVYVGHGGDAVTRGRQFDPERAAAWMTQDAGHVADVILAKKGLKLRSLFSLLTPGAAARYGADAARARLVREVERHLDQPNPDLSFTVEVGLRRRTAPQWFPMCSSRARVITPYLDDTLYELMASLPMDLALDRAFHTDAINRAFPAYQQLPYVAVAEGPPPSLQSSTLTFARELAGYLLQDTVSDMVAVPQVAEWLESRRASGEERVIRQVRPERLLCLLQLERQVAGLGGSSETMARGAADGDSIP